MNHDLSPGEWQAILTDSSLGIARINGGRCPVCGSDAAEYDGWWRCSHSGPSQRQGAVEYRVQDGLFIYRLQDEKARR